MLNMYLERLELLSAKYRKLSLEQYQGQTGQAAVFDDIIWYYIDPSSGRRTRFQCGLHGRLGKGNSGSRPEDALPQPYGDLVKIWIIETSNAPISASEKQIRVSVARKLLSLMEGHFYEQTESSIRKLGLSDRCHVRLTPFLDFCTSHGLIRKFKLYGTVDRDRTGHAVFESSQEKVPDVRTVLALGDIFSRIFKSVDVHGEVRGGQSVNLNDAFVVTFALLSLASPNRSSAEIPLIPKQKLSSYSEAGGKPVHYLSWVGSKGYKDYNNHILAILAAPIAKAVNFFVKICEPARILCRFYESPKQSLQKLLVTYHVDPERLKKLNLKATANLFTLGYALGFYEVEENVPVLKEGIDIETIGRNQRASAFESKPVYSLQAKDKISGARFSRSKTDSIGKLFGYVCVPNGLPRQVVWGIDELQSWWISFFKRNLIPEFPLSFSSGESSINLKNAMFCILGNWFHGVKTKKFSGGQQFQRSKYAVMPLSSLGNLASRRLTGYATGDSIFESYGFSSELCIRPHMLRHMANTIADTSDIPIEIITAWSGRKNPEQTHTYVHTSHEEKAGRVRAVMNPAEPNAKNIRVFSQRELIRTTNMPATLTSTGICTQALNVTPCNYLNEFMSQCFMCAESCHTAGDEDALKLLESDLSFQVSRLDAASNDARLVSSVAMQRWYLIHSRNVHILKLLITFMRTLQQGAVIRYSDKHAEFSLTDLMTSKITRISAELPNFEIDLKCILEANNKSLINHSNPELHKILSSFGLSEAES
ncbi:hypothetical protein SAMN05444062_110176 [Pseudomonas syringae]|uniref:hypothetical protein n=1 Tax=Pseudomonas syringae TaxID=317 RepID=UPI0008E10605|nr:hypothetical protein [Pseudomonas syringae]PBP73131.1 hypothetical protein CCL15_08705 [Pseudomonas syringae]PBP73143.1 hypothetical protein CCL15_08800 [Pseudomonas syringae]SFH68444.1 hypothetical protein SAMN05444062_110176 [Pseudomonas syringae]